MIQAQSLSYTRGRADAAFTTYRRILAISIILNLIVGFIILFWPDFFTNVLGQPEAYPDTWPRHWGAQLWAINLLYLPGYWHPREQRWPNFMGIAIRLLFAIFFITQGGGFLWMALYDGLFGILLLVTYGRAMKADLASQP